jgi:hypothetical protein
MKAKKSKTVGKKKKKKTKAVWDRPAPKSAHHTHLSAAKKTAAKASAKRAGRPYPNLVDNMRAAKSKRKKKT